MKYLKMFIVAVLTTFILTACGSEAEKHYVTVDETIAVYEEYLECQKAAQNSTLLSSDEERDVKYKVVVTKIEAFDKIDELKIAYDELSDSDKVKLENYIETEYNSKYRALIDWLQGTITKDADLEKAINGGGSSKNTANYSDSIQLSSGNYTVPNDIPSGSYDVFYISGTVPSVDIENNGDDDLFECFSESNKSFRNLTLHDGAEIRIESGTVEFRRK